MDLTSVRRGFCFSVYILLSIFPFSSEKNKNDFVLPLLPLVSPANSLIYFLFSHTEVFFADFTTTWQCSQCFLWCWVLFKRRMKCKIFLPLPDQYLKWKAGQTPSKQSLLFSVACCSSRTWVTCCFSCLSFLRRQEHLGCSREWLIPERIADGCSTPWVRASKLWANPPFPH